MTVSGTTTAAGFTTITSATLTITDNDTAGVTIDPTTLTVEEEGEAATYTVVLDSDPDGTVVVAIDSGSSTTAPITVTPTSLSFNSTDWGDAQTVTVVATEDDDAVGGTRTLVHTVSSYSGVTSADAADVTVTVNDDDTAPTEIVLRLSQATPVVEGASPTVTVTAAFPGSVTLTDATVVTVAVGAGTDSATEGTDYTEVADLTVTIEAGATSGEGTFLFAVMDDAIADPDETVTVSGTTTAAGFTTITSATLTITDNDTAGVTIDPTTLTVTEEGPAVTYTVVLDSDPDGSATVTIATGSSTTAPITVDPASRALIFSSTNWNMPQTVTVVATEDDDALGGKRTLTHTVSGYGTVPSAESVTVTVTDDDAAGVAITPTTLTVAEGAEGSYTVALASDPVGTVMVTIDAGVNQPITVSPTSLSFDSTNWREPQTVTVTADPDDDVDGGTRDRTLAHTVSGYGEVTDAESVTVTVTDDDAAGVAITPTILTVAEGAEGSYTVALASDPAGTVMVTIDVDGSPPVTVSPTSLSFDSTNWRAPQTVTVTADPDDDVDGGMRDRTLAHTVSGYGEVTDAESVTVTVTDDDTAGVTITPTTLTVTKGGEQTYTVVLDTEPAGTVVVSISADSGTAPPITFSPASLSFAPGTWSTPQTVTVTATEDDDAVGGTRTLSHTVSGYPGVTDVADVTVRVTDAGTAGASHGFDLILARQDVGDREVHTLSESEDSDGYTFFTALIRVREAFSDDRVVEITVAGSGEEGRVGFTATPLGGGGFPLMVRLLAGDSEVAGFFLLQSVNDDVFTEDEVVTVTAQLRGTLLTDTAEIRIVNDEPLPIALSATPASVGEGHSGGFTVTAAFPDGITRPDPAVVALSVADGTGSRPATEGTDFRAGSSITVTIPPNRSSVTATNVSLLDEVIDDALVEGDETLTLSGTATGGHFEVLSTTLTITDNDTATLRLVVPDGPVLEAPGASATITAMLDNPVQRGFTVTVSATSTVDDTATPGPGGDYTPITNRTLTFLEGSTQQIFEVEILDDPAVEREETFHVSLGGLGGLAGTTLPVQLGPDAVVRITTDDFLTLTWADNIRVNEGMVAVVTATLDNPVEGGFTAPIRIGGGTATGGSDYTPTSGTLSFEGKAGETETFEVMIVDDAVFEGEETFSVSLGDVVLTPASAPPPPESVLNFFLRLETVTVTIIDNDAPVTAIILSVDPIHVTEGSSGSMTMIPITVTALLSGSRSTLPNPTEVVLSVGAGTDSATEGMDYSEIGGTITVTIEAGAPSGTATFDLEVIGDTLVEGEEILTVSGTADLPVASAALVIYDAIQITLLVNPTLVTEGSSGDTTSVTVTASLSGNRPPLLSPIEVVLSVGAGTDSATEGTDYTEISGTITVTIAANARSGTATFDLEVIDDTLVEGNETLTVAGSGDLSVASATLTIRDNDSGTITLSPGMVGEGEGTVTITATLDSEVQRGFTVQAVIGRGGTAEVGSDYAPLLGERLRFVGERGEQHLFEMTILEDSDVEGDETFTVALIDVPSLVPPGQINRIDTTITIIDNDSATVTLGAVTVEEDVDGGMVTVTATLDNPVPGGFTIVPLIADGTATAGSDSDYAAAAADETLRFTGAAGEMQTFRVTIWDDRVAEGDEAFTVSLSDLTGTSARVVFSSSATVTIRDNDTARISLAVPNVKEGDTAIVIVLLERAVQGGFTVQGSTYNDTAVAPADYTAVAGEVLTFAGIAGETQTFHVATHRDGESEGDERFGIELSELDDTSVMVNINTRSLVVIEDNNTPTVMLEVAQRVPENAGTVMATARLSSTVSGGFTVRLRFRNIEADSGLDFETKVSENANRAIFVGTAGEMHTFPVRILDDNLIEGDETFALYLEDEQPANPPKIVLRSMEVFITIVDNDVATVTLLPPAGPVAEDAGTVTVRAQLDREISEGDFTVAVSTRDGTATAGSDYIAAIRTLTFSGSRGETLEFSVTLLNSPETEGDETFSVVMGSLGRTSAMVDITSVATVTITPVGSGSVTLEVPERVAESSGTLVITARADVATTGGPFSVQLMITGGTATQNGDYRQVESLPLGFNGTGPQVLTARVIIVSDFVVEGDETFNIAIVDLNGTALTVDISSRATVTIVDDDAAAVTLEVANAMVAESVGMVTVTAQLDNAVQDGFMVEVSTDDGTAIAPGDYTAVRQRVLNFAGNVGEVQTFTVAIEDDSAVEMDETFRVSLGNLSGTSGRVAASSSGATLTITDNDTATVTLGAVTVEEDVDGGTVTVIATLDNPVQGGFTVEASTGDGTAIAPGDYTTTTTMLTFGEMRGETQTFMVEIIDDSTAEPSETFNVSLGTPVPATAPVGRISVSVGTVMITDDDADNVTVTLGNVSVGEGEGTVTVAATLNVAVQGGFTVQASTADDSATAASDYTAVTGTLLTFVGTAGEEQTFPVTISSDIVAEGDEAFTVSLSGLSGNAVPIDTGSRATVTITDDDATGVTVTLGNVSVGEGEGTVTVAATLNVAVEGGFTVLASTVAGSATADIDYTSVTGMLLTFAGTLGEEQMFPVTITNDVVAEGDEAFTVSLSGLSGNAVPIDTGSRATVTITDDDAAGVTVTLGNVSVGEGEGTVTVAATLNVAVQGGFTVLASTVAGSATADIDYTSVTGMLLTFAGTLGEEQMFPVTITNDVVAEGDEAFTVSLSGLSGNAVPVGLGSPATVTITDDDATGVTVTLGNVSVGEGEGTVTVAATLNVAVQGGFTVQASTADDSATAASDYTAVTGTLLTFVGTAGEEQTFPVTISSDIVAEGDEAFTVSLSGLSGNAVPIDTGSRATVTITDDDATGVTVTLGNVSVGEGEGTVTVAATLNTLRSRGALPSWPRPSPAARRRTSTTRRSPGCC